MALQLGALRDALIDAGSPPDKAKRAAEEFAGCERQFVDVRAEIRELAAEARHQFAMVRSDMTCEFASVRLDASEVKADVRLLKWMLGAIFAVTTATALHIFLH